MCDGGKEKDLHAALTELRSWSVSLLVVDVGAAHDEAEAEVLEMLVEEVGAADGRHQPPQQTIEARQSRGKRRRFA